MAQIFHPSTNTLSKASIFGAVFIIGGLIWVSTIFDRSSYVTQAGVAREQPVPFSHKHHVGTVKLAFVERAGTRDRDLSSSQAAIVTASQMRKERPRSSR